MSDHPDFGDQRQNPEEENPPEPTAPTSSSGVAPNRQRQDRQSTGSSALPDIFPASLSQENVVDPVVGSSQPNQSGPSLPVGDIVPARQSASNIPSEPLPQGEEPRSAAVPASSQAPEQINQDQPTTARQSASHPSDPAEADVNPQLLEQLLELEFDPCIAALAIRRTGAAGLEEAINWIIDHSNESDIESDATVEESADAETAMGASGSTPAAQASGSGSQSGGITKEMAEIIRALRRPRSHKMVFVANMGLKMGVGKLAAQVGHATLGVYRQASKSHEGQAALNAWRGHGEVKIVVKGQSTEQLIDLFKQAKDVGLHAYLVQDAGYTQIPPGSRTVLGVFGPVEDVDSVTGSLKLL